MHFTFKLRDQVEGNAPMTYNKGGGGSQTTTTSSSIDPEFKPYLKDVLSDVTSIYHRSKGDYGGVSDAYETMGGAGERLGAEAAAERAALGQFKTEGAGAQTARDVYGNVAGGVDYSTADSAAAQDVLKSQMTGSLGGADFDAAQAERRRQMGADYSDVIRSDLEGLAGDVAFGASRAGGLGSAKSAMAREGALADRALQLRQADDARRMGAAGELGGADIARAQAEAQQRAQAAGTVYQQDVGRSQAEQQAMMQGAGALAGLDTAAQQRYMGAVDLGRTLGESEYKGAEARVAAETGKQEAPHASAKRYFGYLSSQAMPTQQTSTSSGGGGGK